MKQYFLDIFNSTAANRSIFLNSVSVFTAQALTAVSVFFLTSTLARVLAPEDFGSYRYVYAILAVAALSTLPGLDTSVTRAVAKGISVNQWRVSKIKAVWGLLGTISLLIPAYYYFIQDDLTLSLLFLISAISTPFIGSFLMPVFILQGKQKFRLSSRILVITNLLPVFVTILIASQSAYVPLIFLTWCAATIVTQFSVQLISRTEKNTESNNFQEVIAYGKKITLLNVFSVVTQHIDKVIVWHFIGPVETAIYTIATLIPIEIQRNGRIFGQVMLPRFSQARTKPTLKTWLKNIFYLEILLGICFCVYAVAASTIFKILFPLYTDAFSYSVLAMILIFTIPIFVIRAYFMAESDNNALQYTMYAGPAIRSLCLLVGSIIYGLPGVIIGLVIGNLIELILNIWFLSQSFIQTKHSSSTT